MRTKGLAGGDRLDEERLELDILLTRGLRERDGFDCRVDDIRLVLTGCWWVSWASTAGCVRIPGRA